jgi:hypothetical protein
MRIGHVSEHHMETFQAVRSTNSNQPCFLLRSRARRFF